MCGRFVWVCIIAEKCQDAAGGEFPQSQWPILCHSSSNCTTLCFVFCNDAGLLVTWLLFVFALTNLTFLLWYWCLKQGPVGLTCYNGCLSIHLHTRAHKQWEGYIRCWQWSLRWVKHTCRDPGQVFWDVSWSSVFISSDVKSITLRTERKTDTASSESCILFETTHISLKF